MNRKMTLAGVLAASLILASACGNKDDDKTGAAKTGGKVELTYWSWAPNMDKVVEGWNTGHPDIHVTVNKQDGGDPAVTKLLTAIKAGSGA
jgi:multiple sugar transport system substrate-binding protein